MMNQEFLFYCRSAYEADLLAEIDDKLARKNVFGYAIFNKDSGFLKYRVSRSTNTPKKLDILKQYDNMIKLHDLTFARQKTLLLAEVCFDNLQDRVTEIVTQVGSILSDCNLGYQQFGDVRVEYPDTEDGKQMAKFTKKFTVPLRSGLRKSQHLSKQQNSQLPYLHIFFERGDACLICVSFVHDRNENLLGIKRLKFPFDAPSRSTLKLEEAITQFCNSDQQKKLFQAGMTAVDLGACPGGWTYQLVGRGMHVEAVDNGSMDDKLMATGLVDYFAIDGFAYHPKNGHVDWLVCDMIEQPDKVAKLMMQWLVKGLASAAIFNLKLPMKKRYEALLPIIEDVQTTLNNGEQSIYMRSKHLYHNRDEVTFIILKNSQMLTEFDL